MTTLKEAPPCPKCGSVACYVQSDNVCRHTLELRPSFTQTQLVAGGFEAYVQQERDSVSALVKENQAAKPLRDEAGRAFCQHKVDDVQCILFMGHDQGDEPEDHAFAVEHGPEDEDDDRDEDDKEDDDGDGDTSDDGRLRDKAKGVEDAPNKQVTRRKPGQGVTTK